MQGCVDAFFGLDARSTVVEGGQDGYLRAVRNENGELTSTHKMVPVYMIMWMQIQMDYSSLPNPLSLKRSEILTYYNFIRKDLKSRTSS